MLQMAATREGRRRQISRLTPAEPRRSHVFSEAGGGLLTMLAPATTPVRLCAPGVALGPWCRVFEAGDPPIVTAQFCPVYVRRGSVFQARGPR